MIDKYYNGVIEQVYNRVGKTDRNIVMVCYSNDFSIRSLEKVKAYSKAKEDTVYFAWHEFGYESLTGAYVPFLNTICDIYRKYVKGDFQKFMEECGVYALQQGVLKSFYETGTCVRQENVLLDEVEYEQERMTEAVASMLKKIAEVRPIVLVINRFQMAAKSTMELVKLLLREPSANIGIVLGTNEVKFHEESISALWDAIVETIGDQSQMYHIGSTGIRRAEETDLEQKSENYEKDLAMINNTIALLDFDLAKHLLQNIEHQIKFEDAVIRQETKLAIYLSYARVSMLLGEMSKALELIEEILHMDIPGKSHEINFECAYLTATCYMYQGKLDRAEEFAKLARDEAVACGTEREVFRAELLGVQAKMSGWYNIFFCVQDIPIDERLIELLMKYNYKNHLAHIYVYAYDNRPEVIAKAYRSEAALVYFRKGVSLAQEIGNEQLVYSAYQKNIMLAATNGMNEIAMLYSVRAYQFIKNRGNVLGGRICCGIGYNLSALGYNEEAEQYYNRCIEMFYHLRLPEDIAEVYYNRALNRIMLGRYDLAEHDLQLSMKVIEKLHLNSLRVCNLSKLYGLLALTCALQGDQFDCERYLMSCRQFLNYIIAKDKEKQNAEIIHDYAKSDDDMFLYSFSKALLCWMEGKEEEALSAYENAEKYLAFAEGNQFFAYRIYRQKRMELFRAMGRTELYERERVTLEEREEMNRQLLTGNPIRMLDDLDIENDMDSCGISEPEIEALIKQEGLALDYQNSRQQMEFISTWQKLIDVNNTDIDSMVQNALHNFLNHFGTDRALYIWYEDRRARVLYNDTEVPMTAKNIKTLERVMKEYPQGFAASKISDSFFEHQDAIELFDVDEVCSFVAVPFFKNGQLTSLLITYVRMKDNWHSSIERYMLNDDDLKFYYLLFREMSYSIKRMESSKKIREMNRKLQEAAITDVLTGVYNRAGLYGEIHRMAEGWSTGRKHQGLGLMFADLDNFKSYNDTFGHDVGDLILKEMSKIFTRVTGNNGFVSRYGGDEFILLINTDSRDELETIAKEIYHTIEETDGFRESIESYVGHPIQVTKKNRITCSIGISMAPDVQNEEDVNKLLKRADDLLYSVKTTEKGRYAFI
jgi:diguanylate cyclase (GGDEF)-like protein